MGNAAAIVATLDMTRGKFVTEIEKTNQDLGKLKTSAADTAAAIVLTDRALGEDKGNKALQDNLKILKSDLEATTREIKLLENQKKSLDAALGSRPESSSAPDESARYEAHLRRMDEQERSQRAHAAMASVKTPLRQMPVASGPQAEIRNWQWDEKGGAGGGHGGKGMGNLAMRNAELMHSGRSFVDMMAAGMSPLQAFLMEAPRLFQAFAGSLGALLAPVAILAGGGMFVKWLHDGQEAAKALRLETAGIATNMNNVAGASAENLTRTLAAATEQLDKVSAAQSSTGNRILNALTGGGVTKADVGAAMAVRAGVQNRLDETQGRKLELDQRAFTGDPRVESERLLVEFAEKRNEIYRQVAARQLVDGREAVRQAEAELALKQAILERTQQARQNEVGEETQGTAIRRYGKNVESELARAHLERTQADLANGPQEGPEYQHNFNQVTAAQTAKDEADKRQRERDADIDLRKRNANLRGSSDDIAYQKAVNDRDAIQGKLDDPGTKADERKGLEADLAEAKAQVRNLAKQSLQKGFEFDKLGIQTDQGRGPQERVNAIEKELALIERERKVNREKNGDDAVVNAQLNAQAHALKTEKEDIEESERKALSTAKAQTEEMKLHQSGHEGLAKVEAIRQQYEERILEAQRLGKTELAQQYQLQQKMAMEQARMAAYFSTPGQQAAERNRQSAIARAKERFERDDGLQSIHRGMDGKPIDGYDPLLDERRAFGDHSAYDPKTGAPLRGPAAAAAGAAEPDRRQQAGADPQVQPASDEAGMGKTVSLLGEIKTILDQRLDLKIP